MISLEFKDSLTNNTFRYSNTFNYRDLTSLGLFHRKGSIEMPYIMKNAAHADGLVYSNAPQFGGRVMSTAKLKEVADSAKVPLKFRLALRDYIIGKGFIGHLLSKGRCDYLFVACIEAEKKITDMKQVKYYVSRKVYLDEHKKILPVVKDFMLLHGGDVVISSDIKKYIVNKLTLPTFTTLSKRKEYANKLVTKCLQDIKKKGGIA